MSSSCPSHLLALILHSESTFKSQEEICFILEIANHARNFICIFHQVDMDKSCKKVQRSSNTQAYSVCSCQSSFVILNGFHFANRESYILRENKKLTGIGEYTDVLIPILALSKVGGMI
ncbi:unnamed protein product [Microthlaspi erraticum]|uniref:Uncharacterized protein n=1 Tax=Microthlaspi erraticum TaxID=1685480 RepID=A0A6D2KH06_9BRAS|nr:unnamed protein product [Microthlaspi erraticum]